MKREDFIAMIETTTFDENIKKLFVSSYDMGHYQGEIDQLTKVINRLDTAEINQVMENVIKH